MRLPILRKEFRYRAGGLLAMPVLLVAGWAAVAQLARSQDAGNYESILSQAFAGAVTMICAVTGLACGLWQVLQETRPGSWAFLRHRPVSTTRLLLGKLGAALLIYLLVTGVPLAGVIVWAKDPGHFLGPWLWPMAVPSAIDLLCGTVYVLAGMLIGLREARWFGSRLLPVGLAVLCSVLTWQESAWVALLAIAVAWLVLLPAAWSAMASRGRENRQGWAGRTVTALTLLPAMVAIPMMAGTLLAERLRPRQMIGESRYYYMPGGAELYEVSYGTDVGKYRRVVDEDGAFLKDAPYTLKDRQGNAAGLVSDWQAAGYAYAMTHRPYRMASSYLIDQSRGYYTREMPERWCYLRDQGYLTGYERPRDGDAQLIGYIGANGFTKNREDVVRFAPGAGIGWWSGRLDLVVEPSRIVSVDLAGRQGITVFTAPPGERAVSAAQLQVGLPLTDTYRMLWTAATDKATYVLDEHQKVLLRREHIGADYPQVSVGVSDDLKTFGLLYSRDAYHQEMAKVFMRVSADGKVLTRTEVPGQKQAMWQRAPHEWAIMGVVAPPASTAISAVVDKPQEWMQVSLWEVVMVPAGTAAISMLIAFWLLRRAGERRAWTIFWLITVLLLGISGVLLMLAMRQWAPRVRCGHCGRRSVTSRFTCQRCGTEFAVPDAGAIGIRDDQGVSVASA